MMSLQDYCDCFKPLYLNSGLLSLEMFYQPFHRNHFEILMHVIINNIVKTCEGLMLMCIRIAYIVIGKF